MGHDYDHLVTAGEVGIRAERGRNHLRNGAADYYLIAILAVLLV